jgi:hypothetical protein
LGPRASDSKSAALGATPPIISSLSHPLGEGLREKGRNLAYLPSQTAGITSAEKQPVALIAPRPFRRLHVQQGVFTLFHRNLTPLEDLMDKRGRQAHIVKFVIPASAKPKLRKELLLLQIDRLALFPELENVAARINKNHK